MTSTLTKKKRSLVYTPRNRMTMMMNRMTTVKVRLLGTLPCSLENWFDLVKDVPRQLTQRTPSKKTDDDHKPDHSPVLRKNGPSIGLRSTYRNFLQGNWLNKIQKLQMQNVGLSDSIQARAHSATASKPPPNPNFTSQPMSSIVKNGLTQSRPPAALPVRYATAAAAGVGGTTAVQQSATLQGSIASTSMTNGAHPPASSSSTVQASVHEQATSSPSLTQASVSGPSPLLSSASTSGLAADSSLQSELQSPAISEAIPSTTNVTQITSSPQKPTGKVSSLIVWITSVNELISSIIAITCCNYCAINKCTYFCILFILYFS